MTNSLQFSLVVTQESGVISQVIKLLMEFKYMPLSRETNKTSDPKQSNLIVTARGNGSLKKLVSKLKMLKGVISIPTIKDCSANDKISKTKHLSESIEKSESLIKQQTNHLAFLNAEIPMPNKDSILNIVSKVKTNK